MTFIEKARKVHGDKYDYSKVEYHNNHEKVCIICPEHGEFWQTPKNHLKGCNCPKCSNVYKMSNEEWIEKARKIHGDKYDYSKTHYVSNKLKVKIICPEHGEFEQIANNHIKGEGCILCRNDNMSKQRRMSIDSFILKAKLAHGDKYDYSKVNYINNSTKVCIICPIHGEFWKTPNNHINGQGCKLCKIQENKKLKKEKQIKKQKEKQLKTNHRPQKNTETFVNEAKKKFGDKYDYSNSKYISSQTPVEIICKKHGVFYKRPWRHVNGEECPCCNKENKAREKYNEHINKAKQIHNNKYDYSKTQFDTINEKVIIGCPKHGDFKQSFTSHLNGCGCPKCAIETRNDSQRATKEIFEKRAKEIYGDLYDYSDVEYINRNTRVKIICHKTDSNNNEHGVFYVVPNKFLSRKQYCPKCFNHVSFPEQEIYDYICNLIGKDNVNKNDRSILSGKKEIDIYIPHLKIGFEFNGLFWHSENKNGHNKHTHLNKTSECEKKGIHLIQIFSDEYFNNKEIVLHKIKHLLNCDYDLPKIMARKCTVKEIDYETAKTFLLDYHIQGYCNSTVRLGAFYGDSLVAVMTFIRSNNHSNNWELNRFVTNHNYLCIGLFGKLLSYFKQKYSPDVIKSFADRRWSSIVCDNIYVKNGFVLDKIIPPDYKYIDIKNPSKGRMHKFNFRKSVLSKKYNLDMSMTELEMTTKLNYARIWDCGLLKYVWKNEN